MRSACGPRPGRVIVLFPTRLGLAAGFVRLSIALSLGLPGALAGMLCHTPLQLGRRSDDGREVGGLRSLSGGVRQEEVGLLADRGPANRVVGQHGGALVQQPEQRHRDGRLSAAVTTEESAHRGQIVAEPPPGDDDHSPTGRVRGHVVAERANREGTEDHREMVDRLDRGVGIVHRRGQRLTGHVDELPDAECGVLLRSALEPDLHRAHHGALKDDRVGRGFVPGRGPHPGEHGSGHDVVADPYPESNVYPVLTGQR